MANLFLNLPAPAGNGTGASVDVSAFGSSKTIIVSGDWPTTQRPTISIEINNDPMQAGSWTAVASFQGPGSITVDIACRWMRTRVQNNLLGAAPGVNIAGQSFGTSFAAIAAPPDDGVGAAVDISTLPSFKTVQVGGTFRGVVIIEISTDGTSEWAQVLVFTGPGQQSRIFTAHWMRVRRSVPFSRSAVPGLPFVNVGATATSGGGGSVGVDVEDDGIPIGVGPYTILNFTGAVAASDVAGVATIDVPGETIEDEGTPLAGAPHTTLNFTGGGVAVTDTGGGVATIDVPGETIEDEGTPLAGAPHTTLNFTGGGVTVTDAGGGVATVDVPGETIESNGAALAGAPHTTLNFTAGLIAIDGGGGVAEAHLSIGIENAGVPVVPAPGFEFNTLNFDGQTVVGDDDGSGAVAISVIANLGGGLLGDASDGSQTFDGVATVLGMVPVGNEYTATRDLFLLDGTIDVGVIVNMNGWRMFVYDRLTNNGTVRFNGNAGTPGVGSVPGVGGVAVAAHVLAGTAAGGGGSMTAGVNGDASSAGPRGFTAGTAAGGVNAGAGSAGHAGTNGNTGQGGGGASGGANGTTAGSGAGGNGGAVTLLSFSEGDIHDIISAKRGRSDVGTAWTSGTGGGGGSGGADLGASRQGAGGGGGASGGYLFVAAREFTGTGSLQAKGGNGGAGGNASVNDYGGGGGGGGGSGGIVIALRVIGSAPTVNVTGGTGGAGGTGLGTGLSGANGGDGGSGLSITALI